MESNETNKFKVIICIAHTIELCSIVIPRSKELGHFQFVEQVKFSWWSYDRTECGMLVDIVAYGLH